MRYLMKKNIFIISFVVLLGGVFLYTNILDQDSTESDAGYEKITDSRGGVSVSVLPLELEEGKQVKLKLSLSTHSVDLIYDLTRITELISSQDKNIKPLKWEGDPQGGHHRSGVLIFPELPMGTKSITITIRGVANISVREYKWILKQSKSN
jgi:hypothetical protein